MVNQQLTGVKCNRCGKIAYPSRPVCLRCKGREFTEIAIGGKGKLVTFTYLYAVPEGITQLPLTLGIVEFENGVRVTGQIESKNVAIGDELIPVWDLLRKKEGKDIYGFKFKLA